MPSVRHVTVKRGNVLVLVGTLKGVFLLRATAARARWELGGPYVPGHAVYAVAYDPRKGRRRIWASASSMHWGALLVRSAC